MTNKIKNIIKAAKTAEKLYVENPDVIAFNGWSTHLMPYAFRDLVKSNNLTVTSAKFNGNYHCYAEIDGLKFLAVSSTDFSKEDGA